MNRRLLLLGLLAAPLLGCSSISSFERDETKLSGEVPTGLGRVVRIHVDGGEEGGDALAEALEREFLGQDLFDEVSRAGSGPAAGLWVTFLSSEEDYLYDFFRLNSAFAAKCELEIELRDAEGGLVLGGHVTGVGVDDVTDFDYLGQDKLDDIALSAIHDAAVKISRGLRRTAKTRAYDALRALPEIGLRAGVAPLEVSVLGFDDPPQARRRRGERFTEHLTEGVTWLGPDFDVSTHTKTQRAVDREPPKKFFGIDDYEIALIGRHLPDTRVFIVGRLKLTGGRVEAEAQALDRRGKVLATRETDAEGLGALAVAAVQLAKDLGEALQTVELE